MAKDKNDKNQKQEAEDSFDVPDLSENEQIAIWDKIARELKKDQAKKKGNKE